jgi:uncharacterized protein YbjT (DUF2867 family)
MILVTGATGKTGGQVAKELAVHNIPIRVLVRNADKAAALKEIGAEIALGDMADKAAVSKALKGVDKAVLIMANGEDQLTMEKQFTDCAVAAGVKHLVKLSSMESKPGTTKPIPAMHVASEEYIKASGINWTMVRPTFFTQNFFNSARTIKASDEIVLALGNAVVAPTDIRDVAEVIRLVLIDDAHLNKGYDLTGPEALSLAQAAERFSNVLGREIRYVAQPVEEFRKVLTQVGLPEWRVNAVCDEFRLLSDKAGTHTTDTIEQILGRPPTSVEQFVKDHLEIYQE